MTPEPMSDEIAVLAEVITAGIPKALSRLEAGQFKRRADSLIRGFVSGLKAKLSPPIPPDVQAAMERYRAKPPLLSSDEWWQERRAAGEIIARHFTALYGKDGA